MSVNLESESHARYIGRDPIRIVIGRLFIRLLEEGRTKKKGGEKFCLFNIILANMPVRCNGIQYIVSCSTGHEFESKIKLIRGKNLCFLRSQSLKWLWSFIYCLFLFLLYLLEHEKTRWRKQWKQNKKSRASVKHPRGKKSEYTRSQAKSVQMNVKQHILGASKNGQTRKEMKQKKILPFFPLY